MTRIVAISGIVLIATLSARAAAQEAASAPAVEEVAAVAAEANVAEREIEIENSTNVHTTVLFRADPELLEQKYTASWKLMMPQNAVQSHSRALPESLRRRLVLQPGTILGPTYWRFSSSLFRDFSFAEYFETLAAHLPDGAKLSEEDKRFFRLQAHNGYFTIGKESYTQNNTGENSIVHELRVIAPTAQRAEHLARTILKMLDYGVYAPIEAELSKQISNFERERKVHQREKVDADAVVKTLFEKLDAAEPISENALSDLRNQRRLLAVDLAGVEARVATCAAILKSRDKLDTNRIEQVENIKITAEIELAGLAARRKTLDEIITDGEALHKLQGDWDEARSNARSIDREMGSLSVRIQSREQAVRELASPELVDDKIVIQPIEWGQADLDRGSSRSRR